MQASRVLGWAVGLVMLVSAFFLPFWNLTSGPTAPFDTLYSAGRFVVYDLNNILQGGQGNAASLALLVLAAIVVIGVSGVVGVLPRASGILGVLGMLLLTMGPVLLDPSYAFSASNFGLGYWIIWSLSLVNVFVGVALGRGGRQTLPKQAAPVSLTPAAPQALPGPQPTPS